MNRIAVVIPCYKHEQMTYDTVKSLVDCTESDLTLILVDDNDTYDMSYTVSKISELLGNRLIYVKNGRNIGVNASWNVGINTAMVTEIPYICVANNDLIFTKGWDTPLIDALERGTLAIASPYSTEQVLPKDFPEGKGRHTNPVGIEILGACFAFKRKLIHTIGFVPEQMTHYFGDNWFADQCKMRGMKIGHVYESYIHHLFCITSSKLDNNYWFGKDGEAYNNYCANFKLPE